MPLLTLYLALVGVVSATTSVSPVGRVCAEVGDPPTVSDYKRDASLRSEGLKSLDEAQAIFIGRALSSSETSATFAVTRVWQGDLTTPLTLRGPTEVMPDGSGVWTSDIASDFKIGASYLVFAYGSSLKEARPTACGTMPESKARNAIRILDFLKKSYPPRKAIGARTFLSSR
ncbi:MAG TPA: hypothetical protein VFV98_04930 [Vicinamibacterales bacterium]|nr:hypothetical protein [Vicinamibacterales bacterium]